LLAHPPGPGRYDAIVVAVAHRQFRELGATAIRQFGKPGAVLYDIKSMLPAAEVDARL
jgi:UDP-N-acetyl-D-galactosamine dehydrogenase